MVHITKKIIQTVGLGIECAALNETLHPTIVKDAVECNLLHTPYLVNT